MVLVQGQEIVNFPVKSIDLGQLGSEIKAARWVKQQQNLVWAFGTWNYFAPICFFLDMRPESLCLWLVKCFVNISATCYVCHAIWLAHLYFSEAVSFLKRHVAFAGSRHRQLPTEIQADSRRQNLARFTSEADKDIGLVGAGTCEKQHKFGRQLALIVSWHSLSKHVVGHQIYDACVVGTDTSLFCLWLFMNSKKAYCCQMQSKIVECMHRYTYTQWL